MKNLVQKEGQVINHVAAADIKAGDVVVVGKRIAIAIADIAAGETGALRHVGVFELAKKSTDVVEDGDQLFWDEENEELTKTAGGNIPAGAATAAAGNGEVLGHVKLAPAPLQAAHQADSVAADVATLKGDFNALLAKLQAAGLMENA